MRPPPKECLQPVQNSEFLREFSNLTVRREGGKSIFNDVTFNWETFFLWITWTVCCPGVDACRCCNHTPSRGKFPFHPALRYCDQHCQLQITPKPNDLVFLVLPHQHNFSWTSANEELNKSHYIQVSTRNCYLKRWWSWLERSDSMWLYDCSRPDSLFNCLRNGCKPFVFVRPNEHWAKGSKQVF